MKKVLTGVVLLGLVGCSSNYEGKTAQEWFNLYDEENARYEDLKSQYDGLLSEKEELEYERDDLQSQVDDTTELEEALESASKYKREYEDIKSCVLYSEDTSCYYYH